MKDILKKNKIFVIIIVILVVVLVALCIYAFSSKPANEQFKEKFMQALKQTEEIADFSSEQQYIKNLEEKNYEDNSQVVFTYKNNEKLNINVSGETSQEDNKSYRDINITYGDSGTQVLNIKFLKKDNISGVRFEDVLDPYITVDTSNTEEVTSKLNIEQEELQNIQEKVEHIQNIASDIKENDFNSSVSNLIMGTSEEQCDVQKDRIITLSNSESVTTTAYTLTLTTEQTQQLYEILEEHLKSIQINKPEELQNVVITINTLDDRVVRTTIKSGNNELRVDFYDNSLDIKYDNYVEEELQTSSVIIKKEDNKKTIQYANYEEKFVIEESVLNSTNNSIINANIAYTSPESEQKEWNLKQTITLKEEVNIERTFNDTGMVLLNNYEKDVVNGALNNLWKRLQNKLNDVQNKVQSELLREILQQNSELNNNYEENIENKIEEYNNQFEGYKGDNVEQNIVLNLIELAKNNISSYQIIGENKIKIYLDTDTDQESSDLNDERSEMVEKIKEKIEKDAKYKVSFEYDNNSKISVIILEKIIEEE